MANGSQMMDPCKNITDIGCDEVHELPAPIKSHDMGSTWLPICYPAAYAGQNGTRTILAATSAGWTTA